jgi:exodeoxyribonuclease VII large subunit
MDTQYINVSDLNKYIKTIFDKDELLKKVYLRAEISNFKNHTRGHLYFTLKDETSRINAVMFLFNTKGLLFTPTDGMKVLVEGKISVYEPNGGYQIYVEKMTEDGLGNLYLKYEELKKELSSKGLFDELHKKSIPKYPTKIGIITAPTGAAVKDILSTIRRRYPICSTILFPTLVQGEGAKENIVKQIEEANKHDLDIIILGRGGGSIEDLWAFNESIVAYAIYDSKIPIISAVGHEIDYTISDFVADLRAPTPTGAAEMAVPNIIDVKNTINHYVLRSNESINNYLKLLNNHLKSLTESYILKNPLALYEVKEEKLSNYIEYLNKNIFNIINKCNVKYENIINKDILLNPEKIYQNKLHNYNIVINKLELLNPLNILSKGYSIIKKDNMVVKSVKNLKLKDTINIKLYEGNIEATIERIGK